MTDPYSVIYLIGFSHILIMSPFWRVLWMGWGNYALFLRIFIIAFGKYVYNLSADGVLLARQNEEDGIDG